MILHCGAHQRMIFRAVVIISMIMLLNIAFGSDVQQGGKKIPIEQAIIESKHAHEACRLGKIRSLQKQRELQQALEIKGALPTQYQYDVTHYLLDLDVNIVTEIIYGRVEMTSDATQDNVTFCEIDLHNDLTTDSIFVDGVLAAFTHVSGLITVTLPVAVDEGESFTVTTHYHGHPPEGGFQAFSFSSFSGKTVVSTLSEPYFARTWWPCKDYPDDKADSVDIFITYPSNLFCASNGELVYDLDNMDGTRTTYWKHRYAITTYLVSLAMSEYSYWREWFHYADTDSMPVDFWVYPSRLTQAQSGWSGTTVSMLEVLSDRFGLYPFTDEKYAMSMFNWGGAMEHQTNTSMNYGATYQSITVHEMGHQWWGDMITCTDWQNIWINEGFATYTEALWFESQGGFDDLRSYMNGMRYEWGGSIYITDTSDVWSIFSSIVYDKGAWVLHMLRGTVTDPVFFDIMHTYYDSDLKWGNATTEDFRDICEQVAGIELDDFFQDWIYGTYYPRYTASFTYDQLASDSFRVYAHVRQTQTSNPTVFHMPMINLTINNGSNYDFRVPMVERAQDYVFDIGGTTAAPISIIVDRNDWILKDATTESYGIHIVYDTLAGGTQYSAYEDSVIVRGGTLGYTFLLVTGTLPDGLSLDSETGVIAGTPTTSGHYEVEIRVNDSVSGHDMKTMRFDIEEGDYVPGDADGNGIVEITDAVLLINYVFIPGSPAPDPLVAGDANGDCQIEISDAIYLIEFIFASGAAPLPGC